MVSSRVVLQDVVILKTHECSEDFADVTTWRMWGLRHCPKLARWVQRNHKSPSRRDAGRVYREEGQGQQRRLNYLREWPEAKACWRLLARAQRKEIDSRSKPAEGTSSTNTLLAPWKMTAHF